MTAGAQATLCWIQLPANMLEEAVHGDPPACASIAHVQGLHKVPGSWARCDCYSNLENEQAD